MKSSVVAVLLSVLTIVVLRNVDAARQLCFENTCSSPVKIQYVGGATNYTCSDPCPQGTACNADNGICFFALPTFEPAIQFSMLGPQQSTCVTFDECLAVDDGHFAFSGAIYVNTGCNATGEQCATGMVGPATRAEMTLSCIGTDFYDISLINGVNIGMSMSPVAPFAPVSMDQDYYCKSPGSKQPQGRNPGCSWIFDVPDSSYYIVSGGSQQPCSMSSDCSNSSEVCGTAMVLVNGDLPTPDLVRACGEVVGYWTDDEICDWTAAISYKNCTQFVPGGIGTFFQLYGCAGPYSGSCYQPGANTNCCGCSNWQNLDVLPPQQCNNTNAQWVDYILPNLQFLKAGCPNAYTFPYDDVTSTYQCSSDLTNNQMSYNIAFCPQA